MMRDDRLGPASASLRTPRRIASIAVTVIVLLVVAGCGAGDDESVRLDEVPGVLHGVWRTSHPRYEDAFFEIATGEITIGTVEGTSSRHPVVEIEVRDGEGRTHYRIRYLEGGERRTFSIYRADDEPGVLRLENNSTYAWIRQRS